MRICVSVVIGNLIACLFPIPGLAQPWLDASVRVTNRNGRIITAGSGTVIGSNGEVGLVVTVKHLFRDGVGEIIVRRRDGHGYLGKIWAVDECADLAAIVIQDTGDLPQVQISSGQPRQAVFAGLWRWIPCRAREFHAILYFRGHVLHVPANVGRFGRRAFHSKW